MNPSLTICDECGAVKKVQNLHPCVLRGFRARVCVRCLAILWRCQASASRDRRAA